MNDIRILKDGSISDISNHNAMVHYGTYDILTDTFDTFITIGDNQRVIPYEGMSWTQGDF